MSGKRRIRDPYGEQVTARYEAPAVPLVIADDETTIPVDVGEMAAAAAASRRPGDPARKPHVIARSSVPTSDAAPRSAADLMAEVQVSGTAQVAVLPVRNLSPTGFSVEIADECAINVREGAAVMVGFLLRSELGARAPGARLRAHVTHRRPGTSGKPGGMSLRWDVEDHQSCAALETVLRAFQGG